MHPRISQLLDQSRNEEAQGNIAAALEAAQNALQLAQEEKDVEGRCGALAHLAYVHSRLGHYAQAAELASEALASGARTVTSVQALLTLGNCATYTNDLDRAEAHFHRAADLSRQIGDTLGRASALHNLASNVYSLRGHFELALAASAESHRLRLEAGHKDWGYPLIQAEIYRLIGDRKQARQALAALEQVSQPGSLYRGIYYCYMARLALDEDDLAQAQRMLPKSRTIAEAVGNPILDVWMRVEYSRCARLNGEVPAAHTWARDAVGYAKRGGFLYMEVLARVEQAQTVWASGSVAAAQRELEDVLFIAERVGLLYECTRITFYLAALAAQQEEPGAENLWCQAVERILQGGYAFLLERERGLAFPLVGLYLRSRNTEARTLAENLLESLSNVAPLPLHINGLGGFRVSQGRRPILDRQWQRRRAGELFRYLLLQTGRSASRDAVMDALWLEQSPDSVPALLHQATSTLRRLLEPDLPDKFPSRYLLVEGDRISLRLPPGSTVDFEQFEQRLDVAFATPSIEAFEQALALYTDDLFPQDLYAGWATAARERLSQVFLRALLQLGQLYLDAHFPYKALTCCRRIVERDPWREDAVLLGMQAHLELNDRPSALRLYLTLKQTLQQELNLAPRVDLQELAASLRQA